MQQPPEPVTMPTSAIDKYRLIAELGRGGMGDVYLAAAKGPGGFTKLLVIKQLRSSDDPQLVAMFLEEARLAARVNHPNVVQTYEVVHEPESQRAFMVMEFLDGPSLSRLRRAALKSGAPVPLQIELLILRDALTGLHAAHELASFSGEPLNVVHRDFTPQNLLITYEGEVKIVDFGIAKALDQQQQTSAGVFKGKLTYVPPEQMLGKPVDRRADIFAAGIMLYEAVTGDSPWKGMTNAAVTNALATGNVPKMMEYVGAPPELASICDQAMAVDPDSRYATALELRDAIDEFITEQGLAFDHRQLAEYVSRMLADVRQHTRKIIEQQMRSAEQEPVFRASLSLPVLEGITPFPLEKAQGRNLQSLMTSSEMPDTNGRATPLAPLTKVLIGAVSVAFVMLVGVVAWLVIRTTTQPAVAATAPPVAVVNEPAPVRRVQPPVEPVAPVATGVEAGRPADPVPAAVQRVNVRIRVTPRTARVWLDDTELRTPFDGNLVHDDRPHQLKVSAAGYEPLTRDVQLDRSIDLDLSLNRVVHEPTTGKAKRPPPPPPLLAQPPKADDPKPEDPEYFNGAPPKKPKPALEENVEF